MLFCLLVAFTGCASVNSTAGNLTNDLNSMPGHINGHSITLYNEAVQLEKIGDIDAAIRDFRQSANLGNVKSMLTMGIAYASGHGVLINRTRAKYWVNKAYNKANATYDDVDKQAASRIWQKFQLWKY